MHPAFFVPKAGLSKKINLKIKSNLKFKKKGKLCLLAKPAFSLFPIANYSKK